MTDLHEEIQCRIDYFKQLCRDRQFVDQEMWHYYRGSASALDALLSYMERGINWDSLKDSDTSDSNDTTDSTVPSANNFVLRSQLAKKILRGKELKGRDIREALEKFSEDYFEEKSKSL